MHKSIHSKGKADPGFSSSEASQGLRAPLLLCTSIHSKGTVDPGSSASEASQGLRTVLLLHTCLHPKGTADPGSSAIAKSQAGLLQLHRDKLLLRTHQVSLCEERKVREGFQHLQFLLGTSTVAGTLEIHIPWNETTRAVAHFLRRTPTPSCRHLTSHS